MNKLRTLILFLLLAGLLTGGLPLTEAVAKWARRPAASQGHKKYRKHRRHSRAWWRRYRARTKAKRARAMKRRANQRAAARSRRRAVQPKPRITVANASLAPEPSAAAPSAAAPAAAPLPRVAPLPPLIAESNSAINPGPVELRLGPLANDGRSSLREATYAPVSPTRHATAHASPVTSQAPRPQAPQPQRAVRQLPFDMAMPETWDHTRVNNSAEVRFAVRTPDGRRAGDAVFAPLNLPRAAQAAPANARAKTIGGVATSALRRTVIDRMVAEGGWVVNDAVRDLQGRRVFVVYAQTGRPGAPSRSWTFYFTEVDGRLYSLSTNALIEFAEPISAGSEQIMASIRSGSSRAVANK